MWKSVSSHVKFCWRALAEDYRRYKALKIAYLVATFVVITVLGTIFGQSIWQVFHYLYPLLSGRGWTIVVLVIAIIFLLYLTAAIRRFHEAAIKRVTALSLIRGQGTEAHRELLSGEPLPLDDLKRWHAAICQAFYESYDMKTALALQEDWPKITAKSDEQIHWVNGRLEELDRLIEKERTLPIPYLLLR